MPTLDRLAGWLSERLGEAAVFRPGPPEVHRLALALEPTDLPTAPEADALFLHRAFRLGNGRRAWGSWPRTTASTGR